MPIKSRLRVGHKSLDFAIWIWIEPEFSSEPEWMPVFISTVNHNRSFYLDKEYYALLQHEAISDGKEIHFNHLHKVQNFLLALLCLGVTVVSMYFTISYTSEYLSDDKSCHLNNSSSFCISLYILSWMEIASLICIFVTSTILWTKLSPVKCALICFKCKEEVTVSPHDSTNF